MTKKIPYIILCLFLLGCNTPSPVPNPEPKQMKFTTAYAVSYGDYYKKGGLEQNVLSLDLYAGDLDLDSVGRIQGTGTNLYFSDIFVSADVLTLQDGIYRSDTTAEAMTFLPGKNYEGSITGAYMLTVADGALTGISLIEEGEMDVQHIGDSTFLSFTLYYTENYRKQQYIGQYRGIVRNRE